MNTRTQKLAAVLVGLATFASVALPIATAAPAGAFTAKADIVFAVDESSSMSLLGTSDDIQNSVLAVAQDLHAVLDAKFGLVGFGQADNGGNPRTHTTLTSLQTFSSKLDALEASGSFEPGLSATMTSTGDHMGFRADAEACVVLITDEDADDPENLTAARNAVAGRSAVWFGAVDQNTGNTNTTYGPDAGSLAASSGGRVFEHSSFRADHVPLSDAVAAQCGQETTPDVLRSLDAFRRYVHGLGEGILRSDPVDTRTGAFVYTHPDLDLPGLGIDFSLTRHYDSAHQQSGPLGLGWSHTYAARLVVDSTTGNVTLHSEDAHTQRFTHNTDGTYQAEPGIRSTLRAVTDGYQLTRHDQLRYHFSTEGRLTALETPVGNRLTLTYDTAGNLDALTDTAGRMIDFTHDTNGRLTTVATPDGRNVTYTYTAGQLTAVTDPRGATTTYAYDPGGRLATIVDPNGNTEIHNTYGPDGRVTEQADAFGNISTLTWDPVTSTATFTDAAGNTWTDSYNNGATTVTNPDGTTITYAVDTNYNIISVGDGAITAWALTYDAAGNVLAATAPDGTTSTWTYDTGNRPLTATDPAGNTTTYGYDPAGNVTSVTDPLGNVTGYGYDAAGNVTSVTDPLGNVTGYGYDAAGNVTSVTNPLGNVTGYGYDPAGNVTSETDPLGNLTAYGYDAARNVTSVTDPLGNVTTHRFDAAGNLASTTDAAARTTTYTYNAAKELTAEQRPLGATSTYSYDATGNLSALTDPAGIITTYTYNFAREVLSATDPAGTTTSAYDRGGNLTATTDPAGGTTTHTYDANGRRTSTVSPEGNVPGVSPNHYRTVFAHDAVGNLTTVTDPLGNVTTYTYDAAGRQLTETDAVGNTTTLAYDAAGRLLSTTAPDGGTTPHAYNAAGQIVAITNPAGETTTYAYDPAGNLASITDPAGATTSYGYDAAGRLATVTDARAKTTTFAYDAVGNRTTVTDPDGHTTTSSYDALDRNTAVTDPNGHTTSYTYDQASRTTSVTDPRGHATTYTYDPAGRLTGRTDPKGHLTTSAYDAAGRIVKTVSPLGQTHTRSYDPAGRVTQEVSAAGNATPDDPTDGITRYDYDTAGRLTAVTYSDSATYSIDALKAVADITINETPPNVTFSYDAAGRRTAMNDGSGTESYGYDPTGRLTSIQRGTVAPMTFQHDRAGRITQRSYPDGTTVAYTYDAGRLAAVTGPAGSTSYAYDPAGNLTQRHLPNGQSESRTYNGAGRLTRITTTNATGTLEDLRYTLDATGNTVRLDTAAGTTETYTHDQAGQLLEVCYATTCDQANDWIRYQYDQVGNRTTEQRPTGTTTYAYNDGDQLLTTTDTIGTVNHEYDPDGNLIRAGTRHYAYDAAHRLVAAIDGIIVNHYTHDGDGRRRTAATELLGIEPLDTTYLTWDPTFPVPELVLERDNNFQPQRTYTHGHDLETTTTDGHTSWYHTDRIGTVNHLTDATGSTDWSYTYDPYGNQRTATGHDPTAPADNPMRFAGEYLDPNTDLYHLRARDYDPTTGRFTRTDPLDRGIGEPYVSAYTYADNNPVDLVDPLGLRPHAVKPVEGAHCSWADAVGDAFINPRHDPGTPANPRCRPVADDFIDTVVLVPKTWDAQDGFQRCASSSWAVSVRVMPYAFGSQTFAVLQVEPSGLARWSAYPARAAGGDRPWRSTWQCAQEAMAEVSDPIVYGSDGAYRSQYYCHAFGSVGVPGTDVWAGGATWDLEGWRPEVWSKPTWVREQCNW